MILPETGTVKDIAAEEAERQNQINYDYEHYEYLLFLQSILYYF